MYRYLVIGLIGFSLVIGGYYMKEAGIEKVFSYVPSNEIDGKIGVEDVIGKYLCDTSTGCKELYQITLYPNGGMKLAKLETALQTEINERGTWKFIEGGIISLTVDEKDDEGNEPQKYDKSIVFTIQSVSSSSLSRFVFNTKLYPLMLKPKFLRQDL